MTVRDRTTEALGAAARRAHAAQPRLPWHPTAGPARRRDHV